MPCNDNSSRFTKSRKGFFMKSAVSSKTSKGVNTEVDPISIHPSLIGQCSRNQDDLELFRKQTFDSIDLKGDQHLVTAKACLFSSFTRTTCPTFVLPQASQSQKTSCVPACSLKPLLNISSASSKTNILILFTWANNLASMATCRHRAMSSKEPEDAAVGSCSKPHASFVSLGNAANFDLIHNFNREIT